MKNYSIQLFTFLSCLTSVWSLSAQVEIEKGKSPFHSIVEWTNKGTLLMDSDPKNRTRDYEIVLVGNNGEVEWRKTIYPSHSMPSLILSQSSNYIYFVDHFEVIDSKFTYNQLNQSGSVVSTKFDLLQIIRSYGYTIPDELVVEEVVNTPKALAFHFSLEVKDKNIIENFFVTITHHNNRVYHSQGPATHPDLLDDGREELFTYSGADGENIYFSRIVKQGGGKRIHFYPISPKAEKGNEYSFSLTSDFAPIRSKVINNNLCGSYYQNKLNDKSLNRLGIGIYNNNRFYVVANDEKDRCLKVYGANKDGDIAVLNDCKNPAKESRKYEAKLTWIENLNKLIVIGSIEDAKSAAIIDGSSVKSIVKDALNVDRLQINPSVFALENKTTNFVHLVNDQTFFFDYNQLGEEGNVMFKEK
jgi:hypothetical protein